MEQVEQNLDCGTKNEKWSSWNVLSDNKPGCID
jgi:hypothetical protein